MKVETIVTDNNGVSAVDRSGKVETIIVGAVSA